MKRGKIVRINIQNISSSHFVQFVGEYNLEKQMDSVCPFLKVAKLENREQYYNSTKLFQEEFKPYDPYCSLENAFGILIDLRCT